MSRHHRDHRRVPWRAWARARRAALDRDGWRCRRCGRPGRLEVHHVQPLEAGGAALALANLETVCTGCHVAEHRPDDPERQAWRAYIWNNGGEVMRQFGTVRSVFATFGFINTSQARRNEDGYFFAAPDAEGFDDLQDGDPVSFEVVEPEPAKGPRAADVRRGYE